MKKLIIAVMLIAVTATAGLKEFCFVTTTDKWISDKADICEALGLVQFRSHFQNEWMTNGVLYQVNWSSRVLTSDPSIKLGVWRYSALKAQDISSADIAYVSSLLVDPLYKKRFNTDIDSWLDTFSTTTTNIVACPFTLGEYSDLQMQNNDKIQGVTMALPIVWQEKGLSVIIPAWIDFAGLPHTEASTNKVLDAINMDDYCLAANTNQAVWIINKPTAVIRNASLEGMDDLETAIGEPVRSKSGFLRTSQRDSIMNNYGIRKR